MRLAASIALLLLIADSATAQRSEPVRRTSGHQKIVAMAIDIVNNTGRIPASAEKPTFYICNQNHLHWSLGSPEVADANMNLPMYARLQIEWFWKFLNSEQRKFWKPYFNEADALIAVYLREQSNQGEDKVAALNSEYLEKIHAIYVKAAAEYARQHGVEAQEGEEVSECKCCAAAYVEIVLSSTISGVETIKWIDAGTVWLQVSRTGIEPEYASYAPNSRITIAPGGLYYYKLVFPDGRETKRLLAPAVSENDNRLLLPGH